MGRKLSPKLGLTLNLRAQLLEDCNAAVSNIGLPVGMSGAEGEHMKVVENTPEVHNIVICTLCSCYPWPTLGFTSLLV